MLVRSNVDNVLLLLLLFVGTAFVLVVVAVVTAVVVFVSAVVVFMMMMVDGVIEANSGASVALNDEDDEAAVSAIATDAVGLVSDCTFSSI